MKTPVDILIINNVPSFYKINLYNELAKRIKIHVVFIALTNQVEISNTFYENIQFSYELLTSIQIENRNKWNSLLRLLFICNHFSYKKIIYGGYADFEERVLMFLTPKSKNCLQFESSICESKVTGIIAKIKKIFFNRFSIALPSGKLQTAVFETLDFKGKIIETKGVGLFNKKSIEIKSKLENKNKLKFLFVGRLIPVKNLEYLIRVFNQLNESLTIVGSGILEDALKKQANSNINFTGFINNEVVNAYYCSHDIFILPSISEPWGLVVEEAIYFGLPVLISDAVGCQSEMVLQPNTGIIFSPTREDNLIEAISKIKLNFLTFRQNCFAFDFKQRDNTQINAYLMILSL